MSHFVSITLGTRNTETSTIYLRPLPTTETIAVSKKSFIEFCETCKPEEIFKALEEISKELYPECSIEEQRPNDTVIVRVNNMEDEVKEIIRKYQVKTAEKKMIPPPFGVW